MSTDVYGVGGSVIENAGARTTQERDESMMASGNGHTSVKTSASEYIYFRYRKRLRKNIIIQSTLRSIEYTV